MLPSRPLRLSLLPFLSLILLLVQTASAYQVLISDQDEVRQVCSGMWGKGKNDPFIEVIFTSSSKGQVALVIFEWEDAVHLGTDVNGQSTDNSWSDDRIYICTLSALSSGLCTESSLGQFITTPRVLPANNTIYTTSVQFTSVPSSTTPSTSGPYRYEVKKTGYYCVGTVPIGVEGAKGNTSFNGVVDFENVYGGHLPAGEYPKVYFYWILFLVYSALTLIWGILCYQHRRDLLPLQNYITLTILFLLIEMFLLWRYYVYLNEVGHPGVAGAFLVLVAVLNAARNTVSLWLLLVTCMGYGVVRESLGSVMLKTRLLAVVHFVFGVLYSLGTVSIPLESAGFFIFFFVFPLAFSLTAFLMWIMWSLNATISDLGARRQTFKKTMFTRLHRILLLAVIIIFSFFIISTLSFSSRLDPSFGPKTWKTRWILLDGWLGVLYLIVFFGIAFLWRPTENNRRLALSDEVPTDELEADQYELQGGEMEEDSEEVDKDARELRNGVGMDSVVFDVGSDEDEEESVGGRRKSGGGGGGRRGKTGEERPLRDGGEDSDDEEVGDISSGRAPPPSYEKRD